MKTILVPLDGSPFSEHALPAAIAVARRVDARLDLVHVHQSIAATLSPAGIPYVDIEIDERTRKQEQAYLEQIAARIGEVWPGEVSQAVLDLPVIEALCERARALAAGLIVLSSHGRRGMARAWLGSVADRVIRQSHLPTLVVRPQEAAPHMGQEPALDHVLIPLDGSDLAEQAIDLAEQYGGSGKGRYDLVRVVEPVERGFFIDGAAPSIDVEAQAAAWEAANIYLEAVAGRLRARGHVVMTFAPVGHPAEAILHLAEEEGAGLIVMSTHGRGGVARLMMGSVADKVLRGATAPLLIYRPPTGEDLSA